MHPGHSRKQIQGKYWKFWGKISRKNWERRKSNNPEISQENSKLTLWKIPKGIFGKIARWISRKTSTGIHRKKNAEGITRKKSKWISRILSRVKKGFVWIIPGGILGGREHFKR